MKNTESTTAKRNAAVTVAEAPREHNRISEWSTPLDEHYSYGSRVATGMSMIRASETTGHPPSSVRW